MYCQNRYASLIYKLIALAVCIFGQISDFASTGLGLEGYFYYTNLSNLLCLVYFAVSVFYCANRIRKDGGRGEATFAPRFKGAVVLAITVTLLVYWLLLENQSSFTGTDGVKFQSTLLSVLSNYTVHLIVPLLTILDWVIFDPKGSFRKFEPFLWLVIPFCYVGLAVIIAQTGFRFREGGRYAYFFLDPDVVGLGGAAAYVLALIGVFLVVGYLLFAIDRLCARKKKNT